MREEIGAALQEAALDPLLTAREHMRLQTALHGLPEGRARAPRRRADRARRPGRGRRPQGRRLLGRHEAAARPGAGARAPAAHPLPRRAHHRPRPPEPHARCGRRSSGWPAGDGVTVFLTTQYLEEADALADRVGIIDHGQIVAEGTPAALKAEIGEPSVEAVPARAGGPRPRRRGAGPLRRRRRLRADRRDAASRAPRRRRGRPGRRRARARRRGDRGRSTCSCTRRRSTTSSWPRPAARSRARARTRHERARTRAVDGRPVARRERARLAAPRSAELARRVGRAHRCASPRRSCRRSSSRCSCSRSTPAGLDAATAIPGFPTDSYLTFALAVPFIQGGAVRGDERRHRPRARHRDRLPQPPGADAAVRRRR